MLADSLIILSLVIVTLFSRRHGIGLWLIILVTQGILCKIIGEEAAHLPFYSGLVLVVILAGYKHWSGISFWASMLLLGVFLLMGIAALFGLDPECSLLTMVLYARCFLLAILVAGYLGDEKDLKIISGYFLAGLAAGALAQLYQYRTGNFTIQSLYIVRAASLRGDPNETAMFLVAGIPLALYWLTRSSKPVAKVVMALVGLLLIFGIILTESRGGFVALAAVIALNFLRKPSFKRVLPGVLLASSLLILAPHSYWTRMNTLLTGHEPHGGVSFADRFTLLKFGLKTLGNRPLLGVGPGNYGLALFRDTRKLTGLQPNDPYPVAHNTYLQFFDENGIIAGVLFVAIFFWAAVCFLKYDRANPPHPGELPLGFSFASGFAGLLIAGLFLSEGPNSVLWFMTGIGFATGKMAEAKAPLSRAGEAASCDYCSVSCR